MQDELLSKPLDPATWEAFQALTIEGKEALVDALKAELDACVRSRPADALRLADILFRAAQATPSRVPVGYRGRAVARHVNSQSDLALADYERAIELYAAEGAELDEARIERALIDLHQLAGRSSAALACAARARATFERLGEERQLAQLEVNVGNVHFRLDQLAEAEAAYAAAAARFRALGDETGTGIAEYNRGNVEVYAGRYPEAAAAYLAAREVFESSGMQAHVAECDYARAWMLSMRCRFAEAIVALEAARKHFEALDLHARAPLCDLDLAELYLRLDARWDAIEHATRAVDAFRDLELDYELAKALMVRGLALGKAGDSGVADLDQAAQLLVKLGNARQGHALAVQRASAMLTRGPDPAALELLRAAHAELASSGNQLNAGVSAVHLARAQTAAGDPLAACALLGPLLQDDHQRGALDMLLEVDALRALAEAQLASGDRQGARASLSTAVERIDDTLTEVPGSDARTAFFRDRHGAFVTLARLLAEDGDVHAGLVVLERGRAREAHRRTHAATDPEVLEQRERLDALLLRRLDADLGALTGNAEAASTGPSDSELLDAERLLARSFRERQLSQVVPELGEGVLSAAVRPGEAALCFLGDDQGLGVFVRVDGNTHWAALGGDMRQVLALAERLDLALKRRLVGSASPAREARDLARVQALLGELGQQLLDPLSAWLARATRLLVVPYGALHGLPFHALEFEGRPLAERFEVSYAAALTPLATCRSRTDNDERDTSNVVMTAARSAALPAIAREAEHLQQLYSARLTQLAPGELGAALASGAVGSGGLHLAAHGAFQPHNPLFSGMSFGEQVLTAHDLRQCSLDLELVTLSGCETGRSHNLEGESLIGIDQAFLAAGAHAVVSSLWIVDDTVAETLMTALHEHLAAGSSVGAALARVQADARAKSAHPFDWAPFALHGDPDAHLARKA